MYCSVCGEKLEKKIVFCSKCGNKASVTVSNDFFTEKSSNNVIKVLQVFSIIGFIWLCLSINSCLVLRAPTEPIQLNQRTKPPNDTERRKKDIADIVKIKRDEGYYVRGGAEREFIELLLAYLPEVVYDINNDGNVNCIDYSVIFRRLYGEEARIIINNNPTNGFNHMFIKVESKYTQSIYVEPQGTPDAYSMGIVWGMKYDPQYNKDVTDIWGM